MPDTLASKEVVDHILKHHGVLGMKWGVHRSGGSGGSSSSEVSVKTSSGRGKTKIKELLVVKVFLHILMQLPPR